LERFIKSFAFFKFVLGWDHLIFQLIFFLYWIDVTLGEGQPTLFLLIFLSVEKQENI